MGDDEDFEALFGGDVDPLVQVVPFPSLPIHSCINCGFLYRRGPNASRLPEEYRIATPELRIAGGIGNAHESNTVACWKNAADLEQEIRGQFSDRPKRTRNGELAVTTRERNCPYWTPFRNGHGPVDHEDDLRMMQLEEDRRRWNEAFDERRRKWQEEHDARLAAERREWEARQEADRRRWDEHLRVRDAEFSAGLHRLSATLSVVLALFGAAAGALVTWFFSR